MKIGSLFSGIGGLELGLERAGLGEVVWQVEIDPFCRSVLAKHWPNATRYEDVRTVDGATVSPVDVLCGGFPCTDLSHAARGVSRTGLAGEASGLWREFRRLIGAVYPRFVVVENVAGPWRDWLPVVRRELLELFEYSSVSVRMRAADVGLPHGRPRVFLVAYTDRDSQRLGTFHDEVARGAEAVSVRSTWNEDSAAFLGGTNGLPSGLDGRRLKALGNAVVPQCAEVIGRAIANAIGGAA